MKIGNALRAVRPSSDNGSAGQAERADESKKAEVTFAEVLKSAAEKPLPTKRTPLAGLREDPRGEAVGKAEKEDQYCSFCGSRIEKDGSCPLCGVPLFLSGNPGGSALRTEQTDPTGTNAVSVRVRESSSRAVPSKDE